MSTYRPFQNTPGVDAAIADKYPGMKAIAGPFGVNSTEPKIAKHEKACAVRALRDQLQADPKAKIIMFGRFAWVIRSAEGWKYATAEKFRTTGSLGIKAGRGAK